MRIKTRNDLIKFLEDNAHGRFLRALQNHNENLGGFSRIFGPDTPGWIVRVTSKRGNIYYLAVRDAGLLGYYMRVIFFGNLCSWKYWIGDKSENPLYRGDNPENYKLLRDKEIENAKT